MNRILNAAINEARKSTKNYRHGAVLFRGGKIHSVSFNDCRHAEIDCLDNLSYCKKLKGLRYKILVVRITLDGRLVNSKPCQLCISHLKNSECITKIFYSDDNGNIVGQNINSIETDHLSKATKNFLRYGGTIGEYKIKCCLM